MVLINTIEKPKLINDINMIKYARNLLSNIPDKDSIIPFLTENMLHEIERTIMYGKKIFYELLHEYNNNAILSFIAVDDSKIVMIKRDINIHNIKDEKIKLEIRVIAYMINKTNTIIKKTIIYDITKNIETVEINVEIN